MVRARMVFSVLLLVFACLTWSMAAVPAPYAAPAIQGVGEESRYVVQESAMRYDAELVIYVTTWSDGSTSYNKGGPGVDRKTPNYWNGDSTQSYNTTVKDDDSGFEVEIVTWKRPEESENQMRRRHLLAVWGWQKELGLPYEPAKDQ